MSPGFACQGVCLESVCQGVKVLSPDIFEQVGRRVAKSRCHDLLAPRNNLAVVHNDDLVDSRITQVVHLRVSDDHRSSHHPGDEEKYQFNLRAGSGNR